MIYKTVQGKQKIEELEPHKTPVWTQMLLKSNSSCSISDICRVIGKREHYVKSKSCLAPEYVNK